MSNLSARGRALVEAPPIPAYIAEHFTRAAEPWHPSERPDGYIGLCIAENKLDNASLIECLNAVNPPAQVLSYDAMQGNYEFRQRLATFMGRSFLSRRFEPEQIAVLAGAGSVLEILCYVICDAGDGVLVPTPSYAGFWPDLETRDGLSILPVDCASDDDFKLTTALLDQALENATCPVRALLFTTPNNPLGRVYQRQEIADILAWASKRDLHVIVDEIYALSVFGDSEFVSAASIKDSLGDNVHIVWAFSKDFGASGLRCGVLVSENQQVMETVSGLAYWAACSGHTQHLLSELIANTELVDAYLSRVRRNLSNAYVEVTRALTNIPVKFVPAEGAFFLICDLRPYLKENSWEAERALWRHLMDDANINLTPGEACRINEPGFFRLCYAAEPTGTVMEALRRLSVTLRSLL